MKKVFFMALASMMMVIGAQGQIVRNNTFRSSGVVKSNVLQTNHEASQKEVVCDTLRFPLPGVITYYFLNAPEAGYVTGNNSYNDLVKAEYYDSLEFGSAITGFIADFAIAKSMSNSNADITFGIWDNTGTDGQPGTMVASAAKSLNSIIADAVNQSISTVMLSEPYTPENAFYIGIVLPQTPGDTVALWCREHEDAYSGTAWEKWDDNTWHAFSDVNNWEINTSMILHPIVCKTIGISEVSDPQASIVPNPTNGIVNVMTWKNNTEINLEIYAFNGARVYAKAYPGSVTNFNIDLGFLPKGVYVVRLFDEKRQHSQKVILK
ncbi:MAG: T9SS type A sorting domain-containing protein [Lentimicrobium sp.]|jgi:hypothetical protein|nr:T9SS type A sorting domain-containing protein [Lentimicrobium sp.]